MSAVKENWQTTKPNIKERSKFMFNNDLLSDVKFVVRGSSGESKKSKMVIPAHKFVLSISSPVFLAMFYGDLADTKESVDLPDCEYEGLLELLRYMYSDEVKLNGNNVMQVLYLAKKYIVPSLAEKCRKYLQNRLNASNVFCVLSNAQKYEENNLVALCWEVIDKQAEEAVKAEEFMTIERPLLEKVVERNSLNIQEVELFKAVDLWATKECARQGLETDGKVKRSILGERIVKAIRFPVMKQEEFAGVVLDSKLLTHEEVYRVIKYFSSVLDSPVGFKASKRDGVHELCSRFEVKAPFLWGNTRGSTHRIVLYVDKDILLHGVYMFGSKNKTYSVILNIKNVIRGSMLVSTKTRCFDSMLVESKSGNYYGYKISFDAPVSLQKGIRYCVEAVMSASPPFEVVKNGFSSVTCSGVTFNFENSQLDSRTDKSAGQFSSFLFSLK